MVQLRNLDEAIARLDRIIAKLAQKDETARRLMTIPGFGPITASAMVATIQDTSSFAGPREFAAFLGLTPKQTSSLPRCAPARCEWFWITKASMLLISTEN
jgi:transposase